jgi:RNA polymerase sigma-70 factor (ECF subfamily)
VEQALILTGGMVTDQDSTQAVDRLERLYGLFQPRLYRLARRLTASPEDARDLVQQTFLHAARHAASLPGEDRGGEAWLVRTLVNLCRDRRRRQAVRRRHAPPAPPVGTGAEAAAATRAAVGEALAALAPRRRAVIVMHEIEGMTSAEIARCLGVRQVTVRWHLAAGRRQLRAALAPISSEERRAAREGRS